MIRIKICGITNLDDAMTAVEAGVDALGFVFVPDTPRHIHVELATHIIERLPPFITAVGLFVDDDSARIQAIADQCRLDIVQLHGNESPQFCRVLNRKIIKAIRIGSASSLSHLSDYSVNGFLLDTYVVGKMGGTGKVFDWKLASKAKKYGRIILAGGLNSDNVADAVHLVKPYGVDVSSGVEATPGKKDSNKVRKFIESVRLTES